MKSDINQKTPLTMKSRKSRVDLDRSSEKQKTETEQYAHVKTPKPPVSKEQESELKTSRGLKENLNLILNEIGNEKQSRSSGNLRKSKLEFKVEENQNDIGILSPEPELKVEEKIRTGT